MRHDREVQRVRLCALRYVARGCFQYRKITWLATRQVRSSEVPYRVARIRYTAGRQRIEGQRGVTGRLKVAVNIQDHIRGMGHVDADRSLIASGHDGGICLYPAVVRIQGGDIRLVFSRRPYTQVSQRPRWNHGNIQRIRRGGRGNVAAALLRNGEGS